MAKENLVVSWKLDLSGPIKALDKTSKSVDKIAVSVLRTIGRGTKKAVTQSLRTAVKINTAKHSGDYESLRSKGYTFKVKKDDLELNVYPNTRNFGGKMFPEASVLNYGHYGSTSRARSFTVTPRAFIETGKTYIDMGLYQSEVDSLIAKELKKDGW